MIFCEKCSEYFSSDDKIVGWGICNKHGSFNFYAYSPSLKKACPKCAKEKGICQKCGCDLKTEKIPYYCQGCDKDKTLEEMADPNDCILPGICKECNLKIKK